MIDLKEQTEQQTENICITFIQCWTNVEDDRPTLYKCCANVLCYLGLYYSQRMHNASAVRIICKQNYMIILIITHTI